MDSIDPVVLVGIVSAFAFFTIVSVALVVTNLARIADSQEKTARALEDLVEHFCNSNKAEIVLSTAGQNKIQVIKAIREITGMGLKESKDLVESAPATLPKKVSRKEAEAFKKQVEELGGSVVLT